VVRYHGGKWRIAPWIIEQMPPHRCYVEPFGGGGSVLMRKPRCYAEVYNDLNAEMVNLFRVIRDRGRELREKLTLTPFARVDFMESYEPTEDAVEQARRTVARCFMGFGSNAHNRKTGFRSNSNRSNTTPAHDWRNYPDEVPAMIERLRGVVIENKDATEVIRQHDGAETLHYVDPPYVMTTRSDKASDYSHEMTDDDHRALAETLHNVKGMVILSGYDCPLYSELYKGWRRIERKALADGAAARIEVLWLRNCPETSPDLFSHHNAGSVAPPPEPR
jgi:DNA adenine methylase